MNISRRELLLGAASLPMASWAAPNTAWSSFRGPGGRGVAEGYPTPVRWNADPAAGPLENVRWKVPVPGLAHSSPIVWGERIYLATAIRTEGDAPLVTTGGGAPTAADDDVEQSWVVLCYEAGTGRELWRRTAHRSVPGASRHQIATHANTTLTTDSERLVGFFGSEGLYCYDLDGKLQWKRDLGAINISKYGIGWGYGSSPTIYQDRIALVCDDPENPFLVVLRLSDGKELWRVSRKVTCERSWGTPLIYSDGERVQVVANGWPWIVSYDLETGKEIWRLAGGGDNPIPTPFEADGWIYITNAHGGKSPIYVIRPGARGDITPPDGAQTGEALVWTTQQGGSYISTPVVYRNRAYFGSTRGVMRCFDSKTGEKLYEERLDTGLSLYASLVAADHKIYCTSIDGRVFVLRDGPKLNVLADNRMGEMCFATPAVSRGVLYFRTTESLVAIVRQEGAV